MSDLNVFVKVIWFLACFNGKNEIHSFDFNSYFLPSHLILVFRSLVLGRKEIHLGGFIVATFNRHFFPPYLIVLN